MSTFVFVHAHPDDESITTGGTMAKASAAGHRVVLVVATGGEYGEVPDDLAPGETLADRRRAEVACSAQALGVARVAWLGHRDSGMTGWDQNVDPASFLRVDTEDAARRLAAVLTEEAADVVSVYDWHGNYGHPDHIRVHVVGHRAAELADTPYVYEATFNHDAIARLMQEAPLPDDADIEHGDDGLPIGVAEAEITTRVDVSAFLAAKRASLTCHRSQITDTSMFLSMPDDVFRRAFGTEWYIRTRALDGRPDLLEVL
jgi:LmbE family N-acetylglucosaminyl deacetylase